MYKPLVSIVIPAYNASNYLAEAIDSALAQTYDNIEIIVVNDGSKDDGATEKVALSYGEKIKYIYKENGGSSSALNTGIKNMSGEWFSWLSHDDLYLPNKVERQIEFLNQLELSDEEMENNIFFSACMLVDAAGKMIREPAARALQRVFDEVMNIKGNEYLVAEPTKYSFHGCSCLIHKEVFERIGMFDESLKLLNDVDLWFRLYSNGYKLNYIPEVLVKGRVHEKQVSRSISFSYHNPEQDMYWKRSLDWLKDNHPKHFDLYFLYGRNAYLKTRYSDGDEAFALAACIAPGKKLELNIRKIAYKFRAGLLSLLKTIYLKIKV